ncbi:IS200/IS605 family element transposase accessory protein TnpB [Streptomyces sp. RLB3-6]|nr:IS200/IS605 family element transposase accessory protein TnpB [Streptomyces sp. RLB3-6]
MCPTILVGRLSGVRADLVPDDLWERVTPLLPPAPERRHCHPGRLRVPDRAALAGIIYVLRTGVAWRDVPAQAMGCSGVTAWRRLRDWTEAGVWPRLHAALLTELRRAAQDAAGRWFVSLLCDDPSVQPLPATGQAIGVDVGLDHLLTLSTGEKIANPRHERRDRAALARQQRRLAKKEKGSANRARARLKVARIHARIADRRRDTLHKLTTRLVRENQTIVIEDLTVRNMVKNHRLARAISDAAWSEFRSLLEYKAQWYGREVIAVDRWFPSSRLCSACGTLRDTMPLNVRTWTCDCGVTHDRDVNAAHNLLAAGLAVTVCGAGVRPQRSTPDRRSATKQKPSRREP